MNNEGSLGEIIMKIYTLGNFDIKIEGKSIMDEMGYPYRIIRLFKYFLTFKENKILPENMIDDLLSDSDSADPKNILRTQISRVRNMIECDKDLYNIKHVSGYYIFEINGDYELDVELFEWNILEGSKLKESDPIKASMMLEEGIKLYKGEYLQEMEYEDWLIPIRNRYKRLYLQGVMNLIEILKEQDINKKIVEICEKAIYHDPYSEELSIEFIEALLALGENRYAIDHYKYITSKIYMDLEIEPSEKMKLLYKEIYKNTSDSKEPLTLNNIEGLFNDMYEKERPILYEPEYFKLIYYLELRKIERSDKKDDYLFIITIHDRAYRKISKEKTEKAMEALIKITYNDFRKGDIISKWNENQLVCLLYNVQEDGLKIISNRLERKYKEYIKDENIKLNIMHKEI